MNGKNDWDITFEKWKVASVIFHNDLHPQEADHHKALHFLFSNMEKVVATCVDKGVIIVVFPAYIGCFTHDHRLFLDGVVRISKSYPTIAICPGSYIELEGSEKFHTSCVVIDGEIVLKQRQLYRANWEQEAGFSQGNEAVVVELFQRKVAILLNTDAFYPQVGRFFALKGVEIVLSPMAVRRDLPHFQIAPYYPIWTNVQGNMFFAIESGFKGHFSKYVFCSKSAIHAPLVMTKNGDGFLQIENIFKDRLLIATLDFSLRDRCLQHSFHPLKQLHPQVYTSIFSKKKGGDV